jgi:2-polyprenyl-3-methyl-5-hydroxy-6-metoxy-1,4-benzoquinol methylase
MANDQPINDQPLQEIVRQGFNRVAERYLNSRNRAENQRHLDLFIDRLAPDATILDLGCGAGIPIDEYCIAKGHNVIGLDISEKQIELARKHVPQGHFEVRDMFSLAPGAYQVDAVVSFYAIFHTPREHHEQLLRTLGSFLAPRGWLLITMAASEWEGAEEFSAPSWYGATAGLRRIVRWWKALVSQWYLMRSTLTTMSATRLCLPEKPPTDHRPSSRVLLPFAQGRPRSNYDGARIIALPIRRRVWTGCPALSSASSRAAR